MMDYPRVLSVRQKVDYPEWTASYSRDWVLTLFLFKDFLKDFTGTITLGARVTFPLKSHKMFVGIKQNGKSVFFFNVYNFWQFGWLTVHQEIFFFTSSSTSHGAR